MLWRSTKKSNRAEWLQASCWTMEVQSTRQRTFVTNNRRLSLVLCAGVAREVEGVIVQMMKDAAQSTE
jgi:hypothetical protein